MFHSFQKFEQEKKDNWSDDDDPLAQLNERIDRLIRQNQILKMKERVSRLENQLKHMQNMRREGSKEGWNRHQEPQPHYSSYPPHNMGMPNSGMDQLKYQTAVVNNIIREVCGDEWGEQEETTTWTAKHSVQPTGWCTQQSGWCMQRASRRTWPASWHTESVRPAQDPVRPAQEGIWPKHVPVWPRQQPFRPAQIAVRPAHAVVRSAQSTTRGEYNYGLADNSCLSLGNEGLMSQPDPRSTFCAETYDSQSPLQMSNDESLFEEFMANQAKHNEELLGRLNSLSSKFVNLTILQEKLSKSEIVQEVCSSHRVHNEQNEKMTLQGDKELESFSSLKLIEVCYETVGDESTQLKTNEEQEKMEKPNFVAPPPNNLPIFVPLRLTCIDKTNELELKHPPIGPIIDDIEKKEYGDTTLKVEAPDTTNEKFTKIDLSPQLEECLESVDAMKGIKPHIKYRITVEPTTRTTKKEDTKHVSRVLLNHFWVNFDALTGRKVKIKCQERWSS